jgi:hypothetical protein
MRKETDPVSETSCFLEYRTMEKSRKNSVNSVQHTPSSESFQVYGNDCLVSVKGWEFLDQHKKDCSMELTKLFFLATG